MRQCGSGGSRRYGRSQARRRAIGGLLSTMLAAWLVAASPPAGAQDRAADRAPDRDDAVYTVEGIAVDVSAETAAAARDQALSQGQARGLRAMIERLTRAVDAQRLPPVRAEDVERFVLDFEIDDELVSDVRYRATLTVRFRPEPVQAFLRRAGVPFATTASQPLLVVPLLRRDRGDVLLWEEFNTWRGVWSETARASGLVPMVVPFGDISDIGTISAEAALRGDLEPLQALATKYGAQDSLIAVATLADGGNGNQPRIEVSLNRIGTTPQAPISFAITGDSGESAEQLLQQAAEVAIARVEDAWVGANVIDAGPQNVLRVEARFSDMSGWVAINERLQQVAPITQVQLKKLSPGQAEVELTFAGALPQLAVAMSQVGLTLSPPQQPGFSRFAARPTGPEGLHVVALAGAR